MGETGGRPVLIPSHRHTSDDLSYWNDLEAGDRDYAAGHLSRLTRLEQSAVEAIRDFAATGPCYVATSWGKDATVVAALAALACQNLPLVHVAQPDADPTGEAEQVAEAFFVAHARSHYHEIVGDGRGESIREGKPTPGLLAGIAEASKRFGVRWIGGLRRAEKGGRQFRIAANTASSSAPIFDWSTDDVFAYLAVRNLPVHPRYAMLGGGRYSREGLGSVRVCTFGGLRGSNFGRNEWEREYYGDILNRLACGK